MSGPRITGRNLWPTAVLMIALVLTGVGVAARSEGPVSDFIAGLADAAEESEPDDSADQRPDNRAEAAPRQKQSGEPADGDDRADAEEPADAEDRAESSDPSREPDAELGATPCQAPPLPPTPPEAVELADGCTAFEVGPGEERVVDGHAIVRQSGAQPPACAAFGSRFSWQVTGEPASAVELTAVRQGARYHLAEGRSGDVSGMCGTVSITNPASAPVTLDLRYVLLDCQPTGQAC